jgi:hypothetical protein
VGGEFRFLSGFVTFESKTRLHTQHNDLSALRSASHPTTASSDTQTGRNTFARERCIDRKRFGQNEGRDEQ